MDRLSEICWATPLYEFLQQCQVSPLAKQVLLYVNLVSVEDPDNRPFCPTAPARHLLGSERFAEADSLFVALVILRREKRFIHKVVWGQRYRQVYLEYIARKPDQRVA
jgi:hypothetical protein